MIKKTYPLSVEHFEIYKDIFNDKLGACNKETKVVAYFINSRIISGAAKLTTKIGVDVTVDPSLITINYTADSLPKPAINFLKHNMPDVVIFKEAHINNDQILTVTIPTDYFNRTNFNRDDQIPKQAINAYNLFAQQQRRLQGVQDITCERQGNGWMLVTPEHISFMCKPLPLKPGDLDQLNEGNFEKVIEFDHNGTPFALFQNALDTEIYLSQPEAEMRHGKTKGANYRTFFDGMIHNVKIKFHQSV